MFSVGYGIANREQEIKKIAKNAPTQGAILAAIHFEWVLKRSILKLGCSPTSELRKELEGIYKLKPKSRNKNDYKNIWEQEITHRFKKATLGDVLGNLHTLQTSSIEIRGKVIHGNSVSKKDADAATKEFLKAAKKLTDFAAKHGENLDEKLKTRRKARN